jgi:hypothetical protein
MRISRTQLLPRTVNVRDAWLCIIATEGTKTEDQYFDIFPKNRVRVEVLPTGEDGKSSPQHVLDRLEAYKKKYDLGQKDKLWLMIDVDKWHPQNLAEVCKQAKQRKFGLAVSNPCFELWLWLHHADVEDSDVNCQAIEKRLRARLGSYNKSRLDVEAYRATVKEAVRRAKALHTNPEELWPSFPGTHVYKVVASLPEP